MFLIAKYRTKLLDIVLKVVKKLFKIFGSYIKKDKSILPY